MTRIDDAARTLNTVGLAARFGGSLVGAAKLATTSKGRVGTQRGVAPVAIFKGVCTVGALGATFYASRLGRAAHHEVEVSTHEGDESEKLHA